jgi:hypothetical protein
MMDVTINALEGFGRTFGGFTIQVFADRTEVVIAVPGLPTLRTIDRNGVRLLALALVSACDEADHMAGGPG